MSQHKPRVSVGLPVYNGERYIAQALDALLVQTFSDFELIICDNASTDGTETICRDYAARDRRIRYFRNETNLGAAMNYRRAFESSSSEYFKWATNDDLCAPEFLERCVEVLERDPSVVLAYPRTRIIDESGRVESDYEVRLSLQSSRASDRFMELFRELRLCNALYGLIRADTLRKTALLGNYTSGDVPLLAELTLYGKFWEVPEFLFFRRFHPACSSRNLTAEGQKAFYDPRTTGRITFPRWRLHAAYARAVLRAPLGLAEKARLGGQLVCFAFWQRHLLRADLVLASKQIAWRLFIVKSRGAVRPNLSGEK